MVLYPFVEYEGHYIKSFDINLLIRYNTLFCRLWQLGYMTAVMTRDRPAADTDISAITLRTILLSFCTIVHYIFTHNFSPPFCLLLYSHIGEGVY